MPGNTIFSQERFVTVRVFLSGSAVLFEWQNVCWVVLLLRLNGRPDVYRVLNVTKQIVKAYFTWMKAPSFISFYSTMNRLIETPVHYLIIWSLGSKHKALNIELLRARSIKLILYSTQLYDLLWPLIFCLVCTKFFPHHCMIHCIYISVNKRAKYFLSLKFYACCKWRPNCTEKLKVGKIVVNKYIHYDLDWLWY